MQIRWQISLVVMRWSRSNKLLYIDPS